MPSRSLRTILREAKKICAAEDDPEQQNRIIAIRREIKRLTDDQQLQVLSVLLPFTWVCGQCDAESPATLAEASEEGWANIDFDDGPSWNFLWTCPDCLREEKQGIPIPSPQQAELF